MYYLQRIIILLLSVLWLSACHNDNHNDNDNKSSAKAQKTQTIVAKLETPVQKLYFTGTLSPIKTFPVISNIEGNVSEIYFSYGERIEAGQKILMLESKPLADSYRKDVQDYLQKKQEYLADKTTFAGEEILYNAGVIAKNDFVTAKTQLESHALAFLQAKYALEKVMKTADIDSKKIEELTLADTDKVNKVLQTRFQHIEVIAPNSGVALFPIERTNDDGKSTSGKLMVGDSIKEGQLLLSIGDLSGLTASFDVSEVDIDRIHKNMSVIVTGHAFPGDVLKGIVTAVSSQAKQDSGNSGLSMFSVKINIPNVDKKVMQKIRVGMTAKFEVDIKSTPHIMLPVNAVSEKNGESVVTILDQNGKQKIVPVITGETSPTQVVIISGVKPGDKVLVP